MSKTQVGREAPQLFLTENEQAHTPDNYMPITLVHHDTFPVLLVKLPTTRGSQTSETSDDNLANCDASNTAAAKSSPKARYIKSKPSPWPGGSTS